MRRFTRTLSLAAALLVAAGTAQSEVLPEGDAQLANFHRRINDATSWLLEDGRSLLDLGVYVPTDSPLVQTTLDGKLRLVAKNGRVVIHMPEATEMRPLRAYEIPYSKPSSGEDGRSRYAAEHQRIWQLEQTAVRIATGAALHCDWRREEKKVRGLYCQVYPVRLLDHLLSMELAPCPASAADAQCQTLGERRWQVRRTPKLSYGPSPAADLIKADLRGEVEKGNFQVVDSAGRKLKELPAFEVRTGREGADAAFKVYTALDAEGRDTSKLRMIGVIPFRTLIDARVARFVAAAEASEREAAQARAAADQRAAAVAALKNAGDAYGALRVGNEPRGAVCTTGTAQGERQVVDPQRLGLLNANKFRAWYGVKADGGPVRLTEVRADADELYAALQAKRCTVLIESAANLELIAQALTRDGAEFSLLPALLGEAQLREPYARSLGYASAADLALAKSLDLGSPFALERFRAAGIGDRATLDAALDRMRIAGYASKQGELLQFLADERDGAKHKLDAVAYRKQRIEAEHKAAAASREQDLKARPYRAVLSCRLGTSRHTLLANCFSDVVDTELELAHGGKYGLYDATSLHRLGRETPEGLELDLEPVFAIRAQNASDALHLYLKVIDRRSGNVLYQRGVGKFGVVGFGKP